jgi:hypothetical protein
MTYHKVIFQYLSGGARINHKILSEQLATRQRFKPAVTGIGSMRCYVQKDTLLVGYSLRSINYSCLVATIPWDDW